MGFEIEVKLQIENVAGLRRKLRKLGAVASPRVFERNILYDTSLGDLQSSGRLLRIRTESAVGGGESRRTASRGILTYKSPIENLELGSSAKYKQRQEHEIEVSQPDRLEQILRGLGFHPGFIYEKYRTAYRLKSVKGLILDLDETPIGNYLELEGPPAAIDRAAKLLGFAPQDYITATYWDLYVAHCRGHQLTPGNLVFSHRKK